MINSKLSVFKNILFWIILFFIIRLFGITNPPLEIGHSWRQTLTNMISRNMLEVDASLLYPRIDMGGEGTGIIGAEFPAYNYLIYLWFKFFGFNHWIGRLINLLISSVGIYYFYRIVLKFFNSKVAFYSAIVLLASGWFGFSRKIMPDTVSVSFALISLFYAFQFLEKQKIINLFLFVIFAGLGALMKMPSVVVLSVLIIPIFSSKYKTIHKAELIVGGIIVLLIMTWWYFYWMPHLVSTYKYVLFYPRTLLQGAWELWFNLHDTLEKFFFASLFSFIALLFFLAGVFLMFKKKQRLLQYSLLSMSIVLFFYMMKTGDVFSFHSYYIIPYTPIMALIAGYGISHLSVKWSYVVLVVISIEAIANQYHDFIIKPQRECKLTFEQIADEFTQKDDQVIVSGHLNPMTMYFIHRKGWSVKDEVLTDTSKLWELHRKGANYVFIDRKQYNGELNLNLVKRTDCLDVYDFN